MGKNKEYSKSEKEYLNLLNRARRNIDPSYRNGKYRNKVKRRQTLKCPICNGTLLSIERHSNYAKIFCFGCRLTSDDLEMNAIIKVKREDKLSRHVYNDAWNREARAYAGIQRSAEKM